MIYILLSDQIQTYRKSKIEKRSLSRPEAGGREFQAERVKHVKEVAGTLGTDFSALYRSAEYPAKLTAVFNGTA